MTDADRGMNSLHFGSEPANIRIGTNSEIRIRILDQSSRGEVRLAFAEVCAVTVFSSLQRKLE